MRGTCSECGLEFAWGDVFNPTLGPARGYFENAEGLGLASALRTWLWTLWPPLFWSRVGMRATKSPWRMLLWLGLVLVLQQGAFIAAVLLSRMFGGRLSLRWWSDNMPPPPVGSEGLAADLLSPLVSNTIETRGGVRPLRAVPGWEHWDLLMIPISAVLVVIPAMFAVLPDSRRAGGLLKVHLIRAAVFSLSWIATLGALRPIDALLGWIRHGPWLGHRTSATVPRGIFVDWLARNQVVFSVGAWCWIVFWWWSAVHVGFKLRRSTLVWLAIALPGALVWAGWMFTLSDDFALWLDHFIRRQLRIFD